jgi:hypothetical protein
MNFVLLSKRKISVAQSIPYLKFNEEQMQLTVVCQQTVQKMTHPAAVRQHLSVLLSVLRNDAVNCMSTNFPQSCVSGIWASH